RSARDDVPSAAYQKLHAIPGYAGKAEGLIAGFWDRSSLRATVESRDQALALKLVALNYQDTERRRAEAAELVGDDDPSLAHTFRHGGQVSSVAFSPDGKLVAT